MHKEISEYQQLGATVIRQCVDTDALVKLSSAVEADIHSPGPFYHGYRIVAGLGSFQVNQRLWEFD